MNKIFKQAYDDFLFNLLEATYSEYRNSNKYLLYQEKIKQMNEIIEGDFTKSQQIFIEECFGLLSESSENQVSFAFKKAFSYRACLTKELGV
ncbi:MAG: hypothetical protein FWG90_07440 [Oscillospiraceae bacterium]|nr:hypothetical protein [Oscillospiraceae bacterium]